MSDDKAKAAYHDSETFANPSPISRKPTDFVSKSKDAIGDIGWWLLDLLVFVVSLMAVTYFFSWWVIAPNLIELGVLDEGTSWVTVASTVAGFTIVQAFVISLFQMPPFKNHTLK